MSRRPGILVINFGGPQGPTELVPFLTRLLSDVLPLPGFVNRFAAPFAARRRSRVVGPNYAEIGWSPIVPQTEQIAQALAQALGPQAPPIASGMMFSDPLISAGITKLRGQGCDHIIALGLFPHESFATSRAAYSFVKDAMPPGLTYTTVPAFYDDETYIDALVDSIRQGVASTPGDDELHLLFSPHGLPESYIRRGDPYAEHVQESIRLAIDKLGWTGPWHLSWQSRVGPVKWLEPSTVDTVARLGHEGVKRICIVPVSFICEGIETLHELDIEVAQDAHRAGITHVGRAPALTAQSQALIRCLAGLVDSASD